MKNIWAQLPDSEPYMLEMDREFVTNHDRRVKRDFEKIQLNSLPEPFIGNINSAKVVFLGLNPGHEPSDRESHRRADIKKAIVSNLRQEECEFPFYPLNPTFRGTGVESWWRHGCDSLLKESGITRQKLAQKMLSIE